MKEDITRLVRPCRTCGKPTENYDGYCDAHYVIPKEVNGKLLGKFQKGEKTL